MKKFSFLVSILLFISILANCQNEKELVQKVKEKLDKVKGYKAYGIMKIDVPFINATPSDVLVYYKKPDQFKIIKKDGISLLPKGGVSININSLLSDDAYTIVPAGNGMINGKQVKIVKLLPSADNNEIILTTLSIDERNLVIRKAVVTTRENGTYQMDLEFGRYIQDGLPDKVVFTFNINEYKLPKGITFEYDKGDGNSAAEKTKKKKGTVEIDYSKYDLIH